MDFIKWAKERRLPKALRTSSGWAELFENYRSYEPHLHQIEPTNNCPYTCIMCPREKYMLRETGNMDMALFRKVIDEVSSYRKEVKEKEIELFHFGESLLHPRITEMTGYAADAGLRPTLSINPGELTDSLIDGLIESSPYRIIVSLDSMNRETYKAVRGVSADIDKAIRKTELLLERNRETEGSVIINIRMIVMDVNENEADEFKKFWEDRGAAVELRDFFPWNKAEMKGLGRVEKYPPYMPCPFPWQYLVVQFNGDVVACCRDFNSETKLGNVAEATLKEIWNGSAYTEFREKMATGTGLSDICEECLSIYYTDKK